MKRLIMISCKKATFLISKKESDPISLIEKLQLRFHLLFCSFCRLFKQQSNLINHNVTHLHEHHHTTLSTLKKDQISKLLKESVD